ncbi:MAG: signal peptidase II [Candidatus Humimicrobiaceae bacterium]
MKNKVSRYNLKQLKLDILFGLCAILAIVVDRVSKYWVVNFIPLNDQIELIPGFLYITHIKNSGGAFGIFQNKINVFIIVSIISILLIIVLKISMNLKSYTYNLALGFVLGGAIGNLYDRYFIREVTDFIYVRYFSVFNGADSFIVIGFIILLIFLIKNFFGRSGMNESTNKVNP